MFRSGILLFALIIVWVGMLRPKVHSGGRPGAPCCARASHPQLLFLAAVLNQTLWFRHSPLIGALIWFLQLSACTMKKIFSIAAVLMSVATAASGADFPVVPVKAALPAPVIFSWTGCYIGVEGGGNWGGSSQIARSASTPIGSTIVTRDVKLSDDMVRAGVNVKFNWGQPPAGSVVAQY